MPLGFLCGLSKKFNLAMNPIIQVFKPVSPLAWLPIVFVFVTALYTPSEDGGGISRALLISAGTVTLCTQCAARRGITERDTVEGVRIAGAQVFLSEIMADGVQALVY